MRIIPVQYFDQPAVGVDHGDRGIVYEAPEPVGHDDDTEDPYQRGKVSVIERPRRDPARTVFTTAALVVGQCSGIVVCGIETDAQQRDLA